MRKKSIHAALGSATIQLETTKAGSYEYRLTELSDQNYDHESKRFGKIVVSQKVLSRPSAAFAHPGKTYNFCSVGKDATEGNGDEVIPITLKGHPPFHVEIEVRNAGSPVGGGGSKPKLLTFDNIHTHSYDLRIPHRYLLDGSSHISLRNIRDSRGCEATTPAAVGGQKVQVAMHDAPSISSLEASLCLLMVNASLGCV